MSRAVCVDRLFSLYCSVKTTFHYSSQLQTWLQTWFSTRFAARFSTSSCGFATCFRHAFDFFVENLVAKLLHQSGHVEIDAAGSLVRARARQMECRKKPFRASQRTCWSWIFVTYFIIRAYHDVIKWKTLRKSLILPKNVINCVYNEPALWDTEFTDVHPEITVRIDSYHWLSFLKA